MITSFFFILGFIILSLVGDSPYFDWFVVFVICLVSICLFLDLEKSKLIRKFRMPILFGYFVRIVFLFYDVYSTDPFHLPLVGGPMTEDPMRFYNSASIIAEGGSSNYGGAFSKVFGAIFSITTPSRLWGEYIVLLFSLLTLIVIARIILMLDTSEKNKIVAMFLVCLMPNYILLSVIFRRETLITLLLSLSLWFFLNWSKGSKTEFPFIFAMIFGLLASLFHGAVGLISVFYLFAHFIYSPKKKQFILNTKNIVIVSVLSLVFLFFYARYGTLLFSKLDRLNGNIESLSSVRDAGGSSYARYVGNSNTWYNIFIFAIPRFLYFMYSPFPWQWRGLNDVLTFFMSSVPYLIVLIRSVKGIIASKGSLNKNILIMILLVVLGLTFIFSWGVTNTGTATRHRDKFIAFYAVLYVLSCDYRIRFKINK